MNQALATALDLARQLAAAAPIAWRGDRVFRWAAMGAGLALGVLLLGSGGRPPLPSPQAAQEAVQAAPAAAPALVAPSAVPKPPQRLSGAASGPSRPTTLPAPAIAPGQPLDAVPSPKPGLDRFGTLSPQPSSLELRP